MFFRAQRNAHCTPDDYGNDYIHGYRPTVMHTVFTLKDSLDSSSSNPDSNNQILNMPRLMANANRINFDAVDMQGNAQLYTLGIKPMSGTKFNVVAHTAGNNYVTRRAVKKWHDARKRMFRRLGFSLKDLGPYGATLRPYFSNNHHDWVTSDGSSGTPELAEQVSVSDQFGYVIPGVPDHTEWTYSSAAVSVPQEESATGSTTYPRDLVDTYKWTLLGTSVAESGDSASSSITDQDSWVTVGIIDSWLQSFKLKQQAIASSTTDTAHEDNPLNQIWSDRASSEEVMEIVEDIQKENQPWDRTGATYYNAVKRSCWSIGGNPGYMVVEAPCGLLELDLRGHNTGGTAGTSADPYVAENVEVEIEVLDIRDM